MSFIANDNNEYHNSIFNMVTTNLIPYRRSSKISFEMLMKSLVKPNNG